MIDAKNMQNSSDIEHYNSFYAKANVHIKNVYYNIRPSCTDYEEYVVLHINKRERKRHSYKL